MTRNDDAFIATPRMVELAPELCRYCAQGAVVLDTPDAAQPETVLLKSCGWAGWDLAAARTALARLSQPAWPAGR